jgi:hypothetical protein
MKIGAIYYTHNILDPKIMEACQKTIRNGFKGEIISVSLKPINFGKNIVLDLEPGVVTMTRQILTALENSTADYVFFLEHDLCYHASHFDFAPPTDDTYYYNENVWRWDFPNDRLIGYDGLKSLSGLCCNRELAVRHYRKRKELIEANRWENGRDPYWARRIGYEPGKPKKRGGFLDEKKATWKSKYPLIDIRHSGTITKPKVTLDSFKRQPTGWKEIKINEIKGWELHNFQF